MDELGGPIPFKERLQALMAERAECTQSWLAEKSGLERSTISRLLKGERNPTLETAQSLAAALEVPILQLLKGTDAEDKLADASNVIPRVAYDSVVKTLLDYEARIADLQGQLRHSSDSLSREEAQTKTLRQSLEDATKERDHARRERDAIALSLKEAEAALHRHQEALKKAVGDVASLTARIQQIANDTAATNATSKVTAALAGIAAAAGVATLVHYLATDPPTTRDTPRRTRPTSRAKETPES